MNPDYRDGPCKDEDLGKNCVRHWSDALRFTVVRLHGWQVPGHQTVARNTDPHLRQLVHLGAELLLLQSTHILKGHAANQTSSSRAKNTNLLHVLGWPCCFSIRIGRLGLHTR